MDNSKTTYSKIASTTLLFGSSQIIVMITSIIRTKFVALFLGTSGYGILSLFTSTISLISAFSNLGLGTSAVKELAEASASNQESRVQKVIYTIRKLSWITGAFGAILTALFSVQISNLVFDSPIFWPGLCWLSISIFLNQLSSANAAILRGLRRNKKLANANVTGALFGLFLSIPMYYFWGEKAIVPTLLLSSLISYLRSWYFTKEIKVNNEFIKGVSVISEGKFMLWTGILLSITTILTLTKGLLIKLYIQKNGGVDEVGLYQSGFIIVNSYFGLIFSIMSTDFFPNLSSQKDNFDELKSIINKQFVFGTSLLLPMISIFLIFSQTFITLLFSKKFAQAEEMIAWSVLGISFKLFGWCHSYLFLSKGSNKLYFWNELSAIIVTLLISLSGYYFFRLEGLGMGFLIGFLYYSIQTLILCRVYFGNMIEMKSYLVFVTCILITFLIFTNQRINFLPNLNYIFGIISILFSIFLLKKMGLLSKLERIFFKK